MRDRMDRILVGAGAPAAVLTARGDAEGEAADPIDRIVLPSDGSPAAEAAIPLAVEIAEATDASVDLVHVIPPELETGGFLERAGSDLEATREATAAEALDPLASACREAGLDSERFVRRGSVHEQLVAHADERGADLIVMATHGRGGIERFLVGSVADKVLHAAATPVATVRSPSRI